MAFRGAVGMFRRVTTRRLLINGVQVNATPAQMNTLLRNQGAKAYGVLNVSGVVADTQTLTIGASAGADVYEVEQVNTDTTTVTTDALTDSQTNVPIETGHGVVAGNVILVRGTELMLVTAAAALELTVVRGYGNDAVSHTTAAEVFKGAGYTATRIPVGMAKTVLTAEAFINHFVKVMIVAKTLGSVKNTDFTAKKVSAAIVLLEAGAVGASTLATTNTMTNGDWGAATVVGGSASKLDTIITVVHTVTAQDATNAKLYIPVPSEPKSIVIQVRASTGADKLWNGAVVYGATPPRLEIDNAGSTNWADTDKVTVIATF